ncbi:MAG TPA: hypothetical protein VMU81_16155 [Acetobacteraceae bacterium]|nr:hypothetical protein [Acetobacteraceae bacterium]
MDLDARPFDAAAGYTAGALRKETRALGLSLGERACLALAIQLGAVAVTADRAWTRLPREMVQIEAIR